jgi:hypothetical protein
MLGPIAFVAFVAIVTFFVWAFCRSRTVGGQLAASARDDLRRRQDDELDAMIRAAVAYRGEDEQRRVIAEWEANR